MILLLNTKSLVIAAKHMVYFLPQSINNLLQDLSNVFLNGVRTARVAESEVECPTPTFPKFLTP